MIRFTNEYYCTLTNKHTGVTVYVIQGHAESRAEKCKSQILTDLWLDLGGKHEGLAGEAMEYILTLRDVTLLVMADACWQESSIFGSEPITVLHLYVDSCKKI